MGKAHYLGRRIPTDFDHVDRYPIRSVLAAAEPEITVEDRLPLPYWHWRHDQGSEGACVGFACSMMMSITNELENRKKGVKPYSEPYDSFALYRMAQDIDEWSDTPPEEGTSVRAGCDVMRMFGLVSKRRQSSGKPELSEGIETNRWATKVYELRACISMGLPFVLGINWYSNFDNPEPKGKEYWIGQGLLGRIRGGHAVCIYGASDRRQAFALKNSWGKEFPLVWIPYVIVQRLLDEDGEAAIITDKVEEEGPF